MAILLHQFRYLSFTWIKCLCQPCFLKQVQTKPISNLLNPSTPQTEPLRRSPRKKILYQPCLLEMKFHIISLSSSPYPLTLLQDQSQPTCQGPPQEKQTLLVNSHPSLTDSTLLTTHLPMNNNGFPIVGTKENYSQTDYLTLPTDFPMATNSSFKHEKCLHQPLQISRYLQGRCHPRVPFEVKNSTEKTM